MSDDNGTPGPQTQAALAAVEEMKLKKGLLDFAEQQRADRDVRVNETLATLRQIDQAQYDDLAEQVVSKVEYLLGIGN